MPGTRGIPPRAMLPIIFFISWNCLSRRLTSSTLRPLPEAIRPRRLPLMMLGSARSLGVIERMMDSIPMKALSSMSIPLRALPMPGTMPRRSLTLPIFLICWIWARKSSRSKVFFLSLASMRLASWSSMACWARSTNDTTSPFPRILSAIRSG